MTALGRGVFIFMSLLLCWHIDTWYTPNPTSRAMLVTSLVEDQTYHVDRFKNWSEDRTKIQGHYYSDKAPLSSWITLPLYGLITHVSSTRSSDQPHERALISGVIMNGLLPAVFFAALLWASLLARNASPLLSVLYLIAAIPGSLIGLYAGTGFGHLLGGLLLALAWKRSTNPSSAFLVGLFSALAGSAEFPLLVFVPFFLLHLYQKTRSPRQIAFFLLGLIPGVLLILSHNRLTTGSFLEFAYKYVENPEFLHMKNHYGFGLPRLEALWGLLFSWSRGLVFYAPLLACLFALCFREIAGSFFFKRLDARHLGLLIFFLLIASYKMWEGGWSFGPRHLLPLTMILFYAGTAQVPTIASVRWTSALTLAALWGGPLVFLAKASTLYMIPQNIVFPLTELFIPRLLANEINPNTLGTWFFGLDPLRSHLIWALALVLGALGFILWASFYEKKGRHPRAGWRPRS